MSNLRVASLRGRKVKTSPSLPDGAVITGVATATSFAGNLTGNVTGIATGNVTGDVAGNITGTAGTFSGNVSVGGVITYEDVTSIDSVGIITARDGIKIGAGQSVSAVSGIVTYYGDGSKLSGVESGVANFVASGTIPNGSTVIIKTDGTVSVVAETGSAAGTGTTVAFNSASTPQSAVVYDSDNGKIVIAYKTGSTGTAIVGTVSGTSISFGTATAFNSSVSTEAFDIAYMGSSKVLIAYRDNSNSGYGTGIVGTISGTSISFGTAAVFQSTEINDWTSVVYDPDSGKVVIAFQENVSPNHGKAVVATVSGTSISYGSIATLNSTVQYTGTVYDTTNNKVVIVYKASNSSGGYGNAVVGTVSGTSISFGTAVVFNSASTVNMSKKLGFTNGKVVIAYQDGGDSDKAKAIVGTVSGTSISFGTPAVFESGGALNTSISSNSSNGEVVIAYADTGNSNYGTAITGTVSGTDITFGTSLVYDPNTTSAPSFSSAYDSTNNKVVIAYNRGGAGKAVVYSFSTIATNLTTENYIGIAAEAISDTATGKINVVTGTNTGQTGLTTAQKYFVQPNGTLATSAGDPSVVAGTAISDTKILVRKS
jgi:hypothetical protein